MWSKSLRFLEFNFDRRPVALGDFFLTWSSSGVQSLLVARHRTGSMASHSFCCGTTVVAFRWGERSVNCLAIFVPAKGGNPASLLFPRRKPTFVALLRF
jgi:hypothetical protein